MKIEIDCYDENDSLSFEYVDPVLNTEDCVEIDVNEERIHVKRAELLKVLKILL